MASQCVRSALPMAQARVKRFHSAAGFPSCSTMKPDLDCSGISRKRPRLDRSRVNASLSLRTFCRHGAGGNHGLRPYPGFGPAFVTNHAATALKDRV